MSDLDKYQTVVLENRPELAGILREFGQQKLSYFVKLHQQKLTVSSVNHNTERNPAPKANTRQHLSTDKNQWPSGARVTKTIPPNPNLPSERKNELIGVIVDITNKLLGGTVVEQIKNYLTQNYSVSTADHHGPISHPFFWQAHLARAALGQKVHLVLATSNVSLNNSSLPRSLIFHNQNLVEERLHFFSLKNRHQPVWCTEAYKIDVIQNITKQINQSKITSTQKVFLQNLINKVYANAKALNAKSYADQIAITNYLLWQNLPNCADNAMVYLEMEQIASELIQKFHLNSPTIINQLIFSEVGQKLYAKNYEGISGAFTNNPPHGSFLFWAIQNQTRLALTLKNDHLINEVVGYKIKLDPKIVSDKLKSRELIPTTALSLSIISFYYGLTCGGGFSQVDYLTSMKRAFLICASELNNKADNLLIKDTTTNYLAASFAFLYLNNNLASSIDWLLYQKPEVIELLQQNLNQITLNQAFQTLLPEFYHIITGKFVASGYITNINPILHLT